MLRIAYCSNVHAGADLEETRKNLMEHTAAVREEFRPNSAMGIGLWLSAKSAQQLKDEGARPAQELFRAFLQENSLDAFTFNGFPYGNFHQDVVKRDVYLPTWFECERLTYTQSLVDLITAFSSSQELSISTLPIGWGNPPVKASDLRLAASHLRLLAEYCGRVENETGKLVHICIEPEPGCQIQYSQDIVDFFEQHLLCKQESGSVDESLIRRHIRVCHDVCHAVVMCENQTTVLEKYQRAGIAVGKVQVSSAIVADFDSLSPSDHAQAISQITDFAEDRYMHQTTIQDASGSIRYFDDLPEALASCVDGSNSSPTAHGVWRIHFHVPVYLREFGLLNASKDSIVELVANCRKYSDVSHFESRRTRGMCCQSISKKIPWRPELLKSCNGLSRWLTSTSPKPTYRRWIVA